MKHAVSVLKFGGTSVGSGERIQRVAQIITNNFQAFKTGNEPFPVIVVSAMSGITDQLLRIARYTCSGEYDACAEELESLQQKHFAAVEQIARQSETRAKLSGDVEAALVGLKQDVTALSQAAEQGADITLPTAAVASWGERLSVLLVAAAVCATGTQAEPVRQEVIITSHPRTDPAQPFGVVVGADPLQEETRASAQKLIVPLIEREVVPIAAGFMGRTITGYVTTLGRNGSDYSASVIGAALDCVEVSIYTDVDGILTADPRLVANARLLPHLSYAEAARLSWFGAKVLHPRTLIPIAHRGIPVRVRNTFRPHIRGTSVGPVEHTQSSATAITIRRNLALITVENTDMFGAPENAGQVFALAARVGAAPVAICSSSGHHLSFVIEEQAADSIIDLLQHDMGTLGTWAVRSRRDLAACACIGSGFTADPMSPARAVTALARERIPIVTQGASEQSITLIVENQDSERALRCLHRDLIAPVIPLVRHQAKEKRHKAL
ncbi:aspartate kinase [Ktedonosporobacter rubrisoli]|uniref:Aspartokinase n=1 Tax=Ktedonosporobacter rubrisoli TaxID=2509675 RepID=A0A4P6JV21_KTERU|nr:aspartate kinase [Ktedonosporobacter rubrisoli]QBD79245.1 aspartate kinase [Ktedonosporobacter rubrisoli]